MLVHWMIGMYPAMSPTVHLLSEPTPCHSHSPLLCAQNSPEARGARKRSLEAAEVGFAPAVPAGRTVRVTMSPQVREVVLAQAGGDALDAVCSWAAGSMPNRVLWGPCHTILLAGLLSWLLDSMHPRLMSS